MHGGSARGGRERIWTPSNMLSMFRLLLSVPLVLLLLDPVRNRTTVLLLAAVAYASDLLDGWMARRFDGETTFGRFIDPLADKVLVGACAIALLAAGLLPLWFGLAVIARDMLILTGGLLVRSRTGTVVQSNMTGKMTVVSIAAVLIAALFQDELQSMTFTMLTLASLGLMVASLASYSGRALPLLRSGARH
jgi:CDP-diacylglycerol--glycerol-3-phosphate 3-phosphatidyltransferase